jgi:hypothetical protein
MSTTTPALWVSTQHMAERLGIHRVTLQRLKTGGFFRSGHPFRKVLGLNDRAGLSLGSRARSGSPVSTGMFRRRTGASGARASRAPQRPDSMKIH